MNWMVGVIFGFIVLTLGALFVGIASFARGGEFNRKHGNLLMRLRVGFQFAALILLALLFILLGSS